VVELTALPPLGPEREQPGRWNFGTRIGRAPVPREHANKPEAFRPVAGLMIDRLHRPRDRQRRGNGGCGVLLQERGELGEAGGHVAQLESQATTERDVLVHGVSQWSHWAPPGHGRAIERSETTSTLA